MAGGGGETAGWGVGRLRFARALNDPSQPPHPHPLGPLSNGLPQAHTQFNLWYHPRTTKELWISGVPVGPARGAWGGGGDFAEPAFVPRVPRCSSSDAPCAPRCQFFAVPRQCPPPCATPQPPPAPQPPAGA